MTDRSKSFRLRFRLWTLLLTIAILGIVFGCIRWMAEEAKRQKTVVGELRKLGDRTWVDYGSAMDVDGGGGIWEVREYAVTFAKQKPRWMPESLDIGLLDRIRTVDLSRTHFDDLRPIAELTNLEQLDLHQTNIGDLSPLIELENLQSLNICYTDVDDLSPLTRLKKLRELSFSQTPVRDVSPLAELGNLERLSICGTGVSEDDIELLKKMLPKCQIEHGRPLVPP